jgi:alginate O-acetyltransferase complex protein AlgI
MLFNSGTFLIFFIGFLLAYFLCRNHLGWRNALIVLSSYLFYGWWDYRFLGLLFLTSLVDFLVGRGLDRVRRTEGRKALVGVSVAANLAVLGFFKYYDFFAASLATLLRESGIPLNLRTLGVILPVGISFYTFQSMSYIIDVYRGQIPASRNLIRFLAYVSFFPQLVAGPIERAAHLLPQFDRTLRITRAMIEEGIWLMLWGMFKKVAVADNLAPFVDLVYRHPAPTGPMVLMGTLAFGFQIYCDFSGYSDIARGAARILGFDIMFNFNLPYSAVNLREFWQRWHISLSTWLRDYLYISLGGNRRGPSRTLVNLFVTMLLGGLWHGAAWNFVLWGAWHGVGLIAYRLWTELRPEKWRVPKFAGWAVTMAFVFSGWMLFRVDSFYQAYRLTSSLSDWSLPLWFSDYFVTLGVFVLPLLAMESWQRRRADLLLPRNLPFWLKTPLLGGLLVAILLYWARDATPFIYFQF